MTDLKTIEKFALKIERDFAQDALADFGTGPVSMINRDNAIKSFLAYMIKYLPSENGNPPGMERNEFDKEFWEEIQLWFLENRLQHILRSTHS